MHATYIALKPSVPNTCVNSTFSIIPSALILSNQKNEVVQLIKDSVFFIYMINKNTCMFILMYVNIPIYTCTHQLYMV